MLLREIHGVDSSGSRKNDEFGWVWSRGISISFSNCRRINNQRLLSKYTRNIPYTLRMHGRISDQISVVQVYTICMAFARFATVSRRQTESLHAGPPEGTFRGFHVKQFTRMCYDTFLQCPLIPTKQFSSPINPRTVGIITNENTEFDVVARWSHFFVVKVYLLIMGLV